MGRAAGRETGPSVLAPLSLCSCGREGEDGPAPHPGPPSSSLLASNPPCLGCNLRSVLRHSGGWCPTEGGGEVGGAGAPI